MPAPAFAGVNSSRHPKIWIPAGVYPVQRHGAGMTLLIFNIGGKDGALARYNTKD